MASASPSSPSYLHLSVASVETTTVDVVHQLLDGHKISGATSLHTELLHALHQTTLDCLRSDDAFALFQLAIELASVELLQALLNVGVHNRSDEHDLAWRILRCIVDEGDATLLEAFLSPDSNVQLSHSEQETDDDGAKPLLHVAVEQDNAELVAALLRRDGLVQVNEPEYETGWTALHLAVEWDSIAVQTLLLQAGADINARTHDGLTPTHLAVQLGFSDSVQHLTEAGADLSMPDLAGSTPLHSAAREGHTALVEYLLQRGAKINAVDAEGRTPLHVAAFFDESAARFACGDSDTQVAVVRALLAYGADIDTRDAHGNSVLHSAQHGRFDVIVDVLLEHARGNVPAAA